MASKIKARILEAAIALFADYGYYGVATRDVAKKAKVTEGSIYRLFSSKDQLFAEALEEVVRRSLDPAQFLMTIFEKQKTQPFPAGISDAVGEWYGTMSRQSARLLIHACLSKNDRWREMAYASVEKVISILASSMEREVKTRKFNATAAAEGLLLALFQFKISSARGRSAKEEEQGVNGIVQQWLFGIGT